MPEIRWTESGELRTARWRARTPPPRQVVVAGYRMRADTAYRLACSGTALLWRGDFPQARQLLGAMGRRADRRPLVRGGTAAETFQLYRRSRARRARILGMLLVPLEEEDRIALRRAPDVRLACAAAYGPPDGPSVTTLRELLGVIGAYEWRRTGVAVPAIDARIHPHYGVFSPVRGEYVDLVATVPLPAAAVGTGDRHRPAHAPAFDIGTGTGVLAAVLARRGFTSVVATDTSSQAVSCARENISRLGLTGHVDVVCADLFPPGRAALVVCNPPWIPARPTSLIEQGIYDPDSRMLHGFLDGLSDHLLPGGEGWLILSDLAEYLGLRSRADLTAAFDRSGLRVVDRVDIKPGHRRVRDTSDPLHAARAAEVTSLWRLRPSSDQGWLDSPTVGASRLEA